MDSENTRLQCDWFKESKHDLNCMKMELRIRHFTRILELSVIVAFLLFCGGLVLGLTPGANWNAAVFFVGVIIILNFATCWARNEQKWISVKNCYEQAVSLRKDIVESCLKLADDKVCFLRSGGQERSAYRNYQKLVNAFQRRLNRYKKEQTHVAVPKIKDAMDKMGMGGGDVV